MGPFKGVFAGFSDHGLNWTKHSEFAEWVQAMVLGPINWGNLPGPEKFRKHPWEYLRGCFKYLFAM